MGHGYGLGAMDGPATGDTVPSTSSERRTFSSGMPSFSASSSGVGSRPISLSSCRLARTTWEIASIICAGMRMVRAWSAIERVIAWRIHQVP